MVLLRGAISGLNRSRRSHGFVLTEAQHQQIGLTAIVASAMDMGTTGMGLIGMAGNTDEEADWVEFELSGKQVEGWLWMLRMRNGDIVEVVAERRETIVMSLTQSSATAIPTRRVSACDSREKVHYRKSIKA